MPTLQNVHVRRVVPSVLSPGETSSVKLELENRGQIQVAVQLTEAVPVGYTATPMSQGGSLTLPAGQGGSVSYQITAPQSQGPALITGTITIGTSSLKFETPVAAYPPVAIGAPASLVDVRDRLVKVTNFHKRSGHLLMMDAVRYFVESLNVILTDGVRKAIAKEFAFTEIGLPVPPEDYDTVRDGDSDGLFGIDHIQLSAEDFDLCDEVFEPQHALEFPRESHP